MAKGYFGLFTPLNLLPTSPLMRGILVISEVEEVQKWPINRGVGVRKLSRNPKTVNLINLKVVRKSYVFAYKLAGF